MKCLTLNIFIIYSRGILSNSKMLCIC